MEGLSSDALAVLGGRHADPFNYLGPHFEGGRPVVRVFHLRDLMSEEAYQRIRYDHVRLHRQYVMPNGKRHYYDFYMICFGPMPLAERTEFADDTLAAFGEDGAYHVSCQ